MFCTFTTRQGRTLIIRTEDIRCLYDQQEGGCRVTWLIGTEEREHSDIEGTARENLERLKREELEAIDKAQQLQQRQGNGLPILPVPRGRQR